MVDKSVIFFIRLLRNEFCKGNLKNVRTNFAVSKQNKSVKAQSKKFAKSRFVCYHIQY